MATTCGKLDVYDKGNGSIVVAWPAFPGITPDSFNVYVNDILNQNVLASSLGPFAFGVSAFGMAGFGGSLVGRATITGLQTASYNAATVPPAGDGSHRPESLPPVGKITDALTYRIKVVAVVGGIEVAASLDALVTVQPTSVMLVTPMPRGRFPFPSTPGGY